MNEEKGEKRDEEDVDSHSRQVVEQETDGSKLKCEMNAAVN